MTEGAAAIGPRRSEPGPDAAGRLEKGTCEGVGSAVIDRARSAVLAGGDAGFAVRRHVRPVIVASWYRSRLKGFRAHSRPLPAGVGAPGSRPPPSPALLAVVATVRAELLLPARDRGLVTAVVDPSGIIVWVDGAPGAVTDAGRVLFRPGFRWAEPDVGTSSVGLALHLHTTAAVFGPEHLLGASRTWSGVASPVLGTAGLVGVVSLCGPDAAVVRAAREHLERVAAGVGRRLTASRSALPRFGSRSPLPGTPVVWAGEPLRTGPGRPQLDIVVLGRGQPVAHDAVDTIALPLRSAELLVLLAAEPAGLSAEQIALALTDPPVEAVTVRSEIHRLRTLVGADVVGARPYRLTAPVGSDLARLQEQLCNGPREQPLDDDETLLPRSTAPAIVALRRRLAAAASPPEPDPAPGPDPGPARSGPADGDPVAG